ncbi:MAG: hypothetical protein ONB11_01160 [candidate division KSB1 bacterium]|nr:hypothetical protein [candidate division KSB1 bacterium]MDZ7340247.1 hypothetical protein [candidate division KSB1 bacterium]
MMRRNWYKKFALFFISLFLSAVLTLPERSPAQEHYYYHTIHTHGLAFSVGRTASVTYLYQMKHNRQLKLSGTFIYDAYNQGRNRIQANIFNPNVQLQYTVIHHNDFFFNVALGGGGYYLTAKDRLRIKVDEWRFNLAAGGQAEYYIKQNALALTLDYQLLYLPWSKIYDFLHTPTLGITMFFF